MDVWLNSSKYITKLTLKIPGGQNYCAVKLIKAEFLPETSTHIGYVPVKLNNFAPQNSYLLTLLLTVSAKYMPLAGPTFKYSGSLKNWFNYRS